MAARLGALALAVAMVVASLVVRSRIDRNSTTVRLTCATELESACRAIGHGIKVTVEPAGVTADRLVKLDPGADPGLDGWLTPGPWPQIVDAQRTSPLFTTTRPLATTRLALVASTRRAADCASPTWDCFARLMVASPDKADVPDPATEATGPLVLSALAPGSIDDPAVQQRLPALQRIRTLAGDDAVSDVLTTNGADVNLVAALDAVVGPVIAKAANRTAVTRLYPQPVATVDVVLGIAGTGKAAGRARDVAGGASGVQALRDAGWDAAGAAPAPTDAGLLAALRAAWKAQQ